LFEKVPSFFFFAYLASDFSRSNTNIFVFALYFILIRMNGGWNVGMGVPQYNWNAAMGMHNNGWGGAGNMPHRWPPGYRVSDRWI
jgi:hypothetical protein